VSRALGIDLGTVRIGVATCDPGRIIASAYDVIRRGKDHAEDHRAIALVVEEENVGVVVVGLPRAMSGKDSAATQSVRAEAEELRAALPVPVVLWDERMSTVTANRALIEGGVRRKNRKDVVDKVAAAVILQSWLDAGAPED
jgi:putative Holliday junction resolvase